MAVTGDRDSGAAGFVDKWRARWPEWTLAMVFVPAVERGRVEAWFALLQELTDAAWGGGDPTPGLAKLAWWQEELGGWARGARRHPLGLVLQPCAAPWLELGRALPALRAMRDDAGGQGGQAATVGAFAEAAACCEQALFAGRAVDADAAAAVAASLAGEQALLHGTAIAAVEDPSVRPGTRPRGVHAALVRARLRRPQAALPPLRALLAAWRGARDAR